MHSTLYARLYWTLLLAFCALGLCIAFVQPLFAAPDEGVHWATGHVRTERLLGADDCVATLITGTRRLFPPSAGLPSSMTCGATDIYGDALTYPGLLMSKLMLPRQQESPVRQLQGLMLSRILQGLVVLLALLRVGVLSVRTPRTGPLLLAACVMSPLAAQQAFAVSADGAQLAFAVCMFAAILFWDQLRWLDLALFVVLGWGATAKPFVLTCVLPSVLAGYWFARVREADRPGIVTILRDLLRQLRLTRKPSVQTLMLWSAALLSLLTVVFALAQEQKGGTETPPEMGVDRYAQLARLRSRPALLLELVRSLIRPPWLLKSYVQPLGWLDVKLSRAVTNGFIWLLVVGLLVELSYAAWLHRGRQSLPALLGRTRAVMIPVLLGLVGSVANVFFVTAVLYVLWTPLDATRVVGVQGRYYFGSSIVLLGTLCAALDVILGAPPAACATASHTGSWRSKLLTAGRVLGPALLLLFALRYVARLHIDLSLHYY